MKKAKAFLKIFSTNNIFFSFIFLVHIFTVSSPGYASPEISTVLERNKISVNRQFNLYLNVSWHGAADAYLVVPPEPLLPEEIQILSSSFSSSVTSDTRLITYHYVLTAHKKGLFTIKPFQVKYWEKGDKQESFILTDEVSFEAVTFDIAGLTLTWTIMLAAAVLLGIIFIISVLTNRRVAKKDNTSGEKAVQQKDYAKQKIAECKECKLKGDVSGFFQTALDLAEKSFSQDKTFINNLTGQLEKVQFGGSSPTAEEIERTLRYLEKKTKQVFSGYDNKKPEFMKYSQ